MLCYTIISMLFFRMLLQCYIDSHLSDLMYSFIKHLKWMQMLMVFHTCIYIYYMLLFCAFISCFQYQGCVYFRRNFFSMREWTMRARFCKNKRLRLLIHCNMQTISTLCTYVLASRHMLWIFFFNKFSMKSI